MPDQTTPNVGDALDADQIAALPVGAKVRDRIDTYTRMDQVSSWHSDGGIKQWWTFELQGLVHSSDYGPIRLVSLPPQQDLFQQARVALRDRYGVEPPIDDAHAVVRVMEDRNLTPSAAIASISVDKVAANITAVAAGIAPEPMPPHDEAQAAEHEIGTNLLLVVVRGTDPATKLVVSADTTAGLARLRAHSALDALLDQHGISR